MPFDGACVVCGEAAVLVARYGTEIEQGMCEDCATTERLRPDNADEVLFVQPPEEAVSED